MNTRKYYKFFCFISGTILTIAGCAGRGGIPPKYVEPTSGATASIRFVASSLWSDKDNCGGGVGCLTKDNVLAQSIEANGYCGRRRNARLVDPPVNVLVIGVLHGPALFHSRKKIMMPLSEGINEKDFTEIIIPAGAYGFDMASAHEYVASEGGMFELNSNHITARHRTFCNETVEFEAVAGRLYEAEYLTDSNNKCIVKVNELVKNADGTYVRQPEKTARRRPDQCKW